MNYKQLIIARKDLQMSPGKLAAQVSHASMSFLTTAIRNNGATTWDKKSVQNYINNLFTVTKENDPKLIYQVVLSFDKDLYDNWINGAFTKVICEAKNKNQLLKAKTIAEELGLVENEDFFLIKDNCYTELEPEEIDENGIGRTLTCIGFKPLPEDICNQISKKYQLYK